jgi:hypothetical protein
MASCKLTRESKLEKVWISSLLSPYDQGLQHVAKACMEQQVPWCCTEDRGIE